MGFRGARIWVRGVGALLLSGCLGGNGAEVRSVASGETAYAATTPTPTAWVSVKIDDERVTVDGKVVEREETAVKRALAERQDPKVGLAIELKSERDRGVAQVVLDDTGWREKVLRVDDWQLELESESVAADAGAHPIIIFANLLAGLTELWRMDMRDESSGSLATVKAGEAVGTSAAVAQLEQLCHGHLCSGFADLAPDAPVVATLKEWKRLTGGIPTQIRLRLPLKTLDGRAGPVAGRLAPEVIQTIVRHYFKDIRTCYERLLAKDAEAQGRISVKFIIDREGHVASSNNGGSSLTDADVNACVVDVFKRMSFPPPQGGIVTVIYPIMLAPD